MYSLLLFAVIAAPAQTVDVSVSVLGHGVTGSGTFIKKTEDGDLFVLTAGHVIKPSMENKTPVFIMQDFNDEDGNKISSVVVLTEIVACSELPDLAILKVKDKRYWAGKNFAALDKTAACVVGEDICMVGSPLGIHESNRGILVKGIIAKKRTMVGTQIVSRADISCNSGCSGGGVFEWKTGKYLGVMVMASPDHNSGLFVPMDVVAEWMSKIGFLKL